MNKLEHYLNKGWQIKLEVEKDALTKETTYTVWLFGREGYDDLVGVGETMQQLIVDLEDCEREFNREKNCLVKSAIKGRFDVHLYPLLYMKYQEKYKILLIKSFKETIFMNLNDYVRSWKNSIQPISYEYSIIEDYCNKLLEAMEQLVGNVSAETFWNVLPHIMGIDSRLALLDELSALLKDEHFSLDPEEVIGWVEHDYKSYVKELCGYNLNSKTNGSLIFYVQ